MRAHTHTGPLLKSTTTDTCPSSCPRPRLGDWMGIQPTPRSPSRAAAALLSPPAHGDRGLGRPRTLHTLRCPAAQPAAHPAWACGTPAAPAQPCPVPSTSVITKHLRRPLGPSRHHLRAALAGQADSEQTGCSTYQSNTCKLEPLSNYANTKGNRNYRQPHQPHPPKWCKAASPGRSGPQSPAPGRQASSVPCPPSLFVQLESVF